MILFVEVEPFFVLLFKKNKSRAICIAIDNL